MKAFLADCGHKKCGARRVSIEVVNETQHPRRRGTFFVLGFCPHCFHPIAAEMIALEPEQAARLENASLDQCLAKAFQGGRMKEFSNYWPPSPTPSSPAHLPADIENAFIQAENNRNQINMEKPAATSYRGAIELGVKHASGKEVKNLKTAIDALAEEQKITKDLAEWSHAVRIIGNDGAHHDVTKEDVEDARTLSQQILTYLFTLPAQLQIRKDRKAAEADTIIGKPAKAIAVEAN